MTNHAGLKELAEKATLGNWQTPGNWRALETHVFLGDGGFDLKGAPNPHNGNYILDFRNAVG